jgi:hypothetical protein
MLESVQKKWTLFDGVTLKKIVKGACWAVGPAAGIAFFQYIGTIVVDNVVLASFIAWLVPTGINAINEYRKGV